MKNITYEDFDAVDMRSGTIVKVEEFSRATRPSFKIWVDFGSDIGTLQTSAQVTVHYTTDTLVGRQVVGCINLGEKNIAGFISQFLLLGFTDSNGANCLMTVNPNVPNGQKMC
jgi:tRNA-binding protein